MVALSEGIDYEQDSHISSHVSQKVPDHRHRAIGLVLTLRLCCVIGINGVLKVW